MDNSPSQSPTRAGTWHKQSGSQAATDGTLPVRSKDRAITTTKSYGSKVQELPTSPTSDLNLSPNSRSKKPPVKANVKVKRSNPSTSVPTSVPQLTRPPSTLPLSSGTKRKAPLEASSGKRKPFKTSSTSTSKVLKARTTGLGEVTQSTKENSSSLSRYRKQMLGRHRRSGQVFGRKKGFVTV